jgi:hypothetical protein
MGVTAAIQAETDRAVAEEQYILTLIDGNLRADLTAETNRAEAAEAALQAAIDAEKARAMAAEAALGATALPGMRVGQAASDSTGSVHVTFSTPFAAACDGVVATAGLNCWINPSALTASGFTATTTSPLFGGNWQKGPMGFWYIAFGH